MLFFRKSDDLKKDLIYVVKEYGKPFFISDDFDSAMMYYKKCLDFDFVLDRSYSVDCIYYLDFYVTTRGNFLEFIKTGSYNSSIAMNLLLNVSHYFVYSDFVQAYIFNRNNNYCKLYQDDYNCVKEQLTRQLKKIELI